MEKVVTFATWVIGIVMTIWGFWANGPAFFFPWLLLCFLLFGAWGFYVGSRGAAENRQKLEAMAPEAREHYVKYKAKIAEESGKTYRYGLKNEALVCPHCQTKGKVRSEVGEDVTRTKVIPVVGNTIKTKRKVTRMHCDNCGTDWSV